MTIERPPNQIGVRELRDRLTTVVEQVRQGQPYVVLVNNEPVAVMISYSEATWWERVEMGLAALGGLEIYPEVARDTSELANLVSGKRRVTQRELKALSGDPREVFPRMELVVGTSEARRRMTEILPQVFHGGTTTLVSGGQFAVVMISPREYQRLRPLRRIVSWFNAAGLNLAEAEVDEIVRWVGARRAEPSAADAADEGSAIA
jgi:prevent-host-death family protein